MSLVLSTPFRGFELQFWPWSLAPCRGEVGNARDTLISWLCVVRYVYPFYKEGADPKKVLGANERMYSQCKRIQIVTWSFDCRGERNLSEMMWVLWSYHRSDFKAHCNITYGCSYTIHFRWFEVESHRAHGQHSGLHANNSSHCKIALLASTSDI